MQNIGGYMEIINITNENFEDEILKSRGKVLLDFWAAWCGPCKMVAPVLEQIAAENPDVKIGKVNVDEQPELAGRFMVQSIPTLVIFRDGMPISKTVGAQPKEAIEAFIAKA